jgi:hypothetical protein
MSIKNSNYTIGNRIRDRPTYSAVPQPTAPPRAARIANNKSHIRTKHLINSSPDSYDLDEDAASLTLFISKGNFKDQAVSVR